MCVCFCNLSCGKNAFSQNIVHILHVVLYVQLSYRHQSHIATTAVCPLWIAMRSGVTPSFLTCIESKGGGDPDGPTYPDGPTAHWFRLDRTTAEGVLLLKNGWETAGYDDGRPVEHLSSCIELTVTGVWPQSPTCIKASPARNSETDGGLPRLDAVTLRAFGVPVLRPEVSDSLWGEPGR